MMRRRTVTAPDGARWRVGRRWMPARAVEVRRRLPAPTLRGISRDWLDGVWAVDFGDADDLGVIVVAVVAALVVGILLVFVVLPLIGLAVELAVPVVLLGTSVVGRVLFRRPWVVEAVNVDRPEQRAELPVKGWRASGRAIVAIERAIECNGVPPAVDAALAAGG